MTPPSSLSCERHGAGSDISEARCPCSPTTSARLARRALGPRSRLRSDPSFAPPLCRLDRVAQLYARACFFRACARGCPGGVSGRACEGVARDGEPRDGAAPAAARQELPRRRGRGASSRRSRRLSSLVRARHRVWRRVRIAPRRRRDDDSLTQRCVCAVASRRRRDDDSSAMCVCACVCGRIATCSCARRTACWSRTRGGAVVLWRRRPPTPPLSLYALARQMERSAARASPFWTAAEAGPDAEVEMRTTWRVRIASLPHQAVTVTRRGPTPR